MRRFTRLAIAAGATFAALACAGPVWAAYSPSLYVTSERVTAGRPTAIILGHVQSASDDPTAKDTIYAPPGYAVNLTQPAGTKIGDVSARLILRQGGNAEVDVSGQVIADNPANYANNQCAPGLHQAVWKLDITVAGTPLTVPIYVDPVTAGPEATFASAKIQLCLAGPVGTPAGAQLLFAFFDVNGVFTNPSAAGRRIWRGVFTPYTPGTPNPNPAGTTEGQAVVPGTVSLSLKTKSLKRGRVIITGRLLVDGQPLRGVTVEFYLPGRDRPAFRARTNAQGRFTVRRKIKKRTRWIAQILLLGDLAAPPCPATPLPPTSVPQGCKTATLSFFVSKTITAKRRR
jgi:hypothetical protein